MAPLTAGPFTHSARSVPATMGWVILALLPATLFGLWHYGWPAIFLFLVTIIAAIVAEALSLKIAAKPIKPALLDGSALLTGWLLALTLPPWAPWWIGVVGSLLAIVIAKQLFGGIGQNLFNPAMVARVALLISFPLEMTQFYAPMPLFSPSAPGFLEGLQITFFGVGHYDAVSSATTLGYLKTELGREIPLSQAESGVASISSMAWGDSAGSLGEGSALLLLLGGGWLLYKKVISWHIPVAMLLTILILAALFHWIDSERYVGPLYHLLSAATMLGAFFIATDLVTSPVTRTGQILFGAGCGLLTFVIRTWAGYPEGVAFAVLLMNGATPLIDHYIKPRIYGRDRHGQPLNRRSPEES